MSDPRAFDLRTEYQLNPLALATRRPRFSWLIRDKTPGARQRAYRLIVASAPDAARAGRGDLWDSGRVESDAQSQVEYAGTPLTSRQRAWWAVQLWNDSPEPGAWSDIATFESGLQEPGDWVGQFVGSTLAGTGQTGAPSPLLRRGFNVEAAVVNARLHITALGLYESTINGTRIGEDWLRPGWTDYSKRVNSQTYDVTKTLRVGENVLGVVLGDGWYCGRVGPHDRGATWGGAPSVLAQLELTLSDGSTRRIVSDGHWRWMSGPILRSDLIDGEEYDARQAIEGWDLPGFDAQDWHPVKIFERPEISIHPSAAPPVRVITELAPIAVTTPRAAWERSVKIFDFGQNLTGVVRFKLRGPRGCTLVMRHAEVLRPDGSLDVSNLRSARQTDIYTFRGDPEGEAFCPRFTLHGFRYVEITASYDAFHRQDGWALNPTVEDVRAVVLASDTPDVGTFACDHPRLNQLQSNIRWGMRGNFIEVPTDCPQRDERLGWTGDTQVFASTASFLAETAPFYTKWMLDLADAQLADGAIPSIVPKIGPHWNKDGESGWSDAVIVVPLETYYATGDRRLLEQSFPLQVRWVEYLTATSKDGIRPIGEHITHYGYGDWLALDGDATDPFKPNGTPKELIATAHFAEALEKIAKVCDILGKSGDAIAFRQQRERVVAAFNREFVTGSGRLAAPSQTSYLLALAFDLLPEAQRPAALERLIDLIAARDWHLSTGFLGTPLLCPVLTRFGRPDIAYKVLLQETYPGWLYPVTLGATTMWERWNSWHPELGFVEVGMNSLNHYAYGAVGKWMYSTIAGLDLDETEPGYRRAIFRPRPGGGIRHANASIQTMRGKFAIDWHLSDTGQFDVTIEVPPNAQARLVLPNGETSDLGAGHHSAMCEITSTVESV